LDRTTDDRINKQILQYEPEAEADLEKDATIM
jgi:hypothetical protein